MVELPKTEEELKALLDARAEEVTKELNAKHDRDMSALRVKHKKELDEAQLSQEQLAEKKAQELQAEKEQELNDLRTFKRTTIIKEKITSAGLPQYFVNDVRLQSAEEGDLDKVVKVIKTDYEATLPKGSTHSTVVQTGGTTTPKGGTSGGKTDGPDYSPLAGALEEVLK